MWRRLICWLVGHDWTPPRRLVARPGRASLYITRCRYCDLRAAGDWNEMEWLEAWQHERGGLGNRGPE